MKKEIFDRKFMLESFIYGFNLGVILASTILMFGCYNMVMSSGKVMTVLGSRFPNVAMAFSTTLNFVSKTSYIYKRLRDNNPPGFAFINTLTALALEEATDMGNSMEYRGYARGKRTSIYSQSLTGKDFVFLSIIILCGILSIIFYKFSDTYIYIYPYLDTNFDKCGIISYFLLGIIFFLPFFINLTKEIIWYRACEN